MSCVKELEESSMEYVGTVVEKSTMEPISGVWVKITNGDKIYMSDTTDNRGAFDLKNVNTAELKEDYYLLIDGSVLGLPQRKEELKGFGQSLYDYKTIPLYDKTADSLYPVISIPTISGITVNSAVCNARVTVSPDGFSVSDKGFVWSALQDPVLNVNDSNHLSMGEGAGEMTGSLISLAKNTTYYIRAYATTSIGTTYGEQTSFVTIEGLPTVSINAVSDISATSAVCGGSISSNGGYGITAKGLVWSTSQFPTLEDNHLGLGSGDATFNGSMTNLSVSTTYYVRAYATNINGTAYSNQLSFTTKSGLPTVTTTAAGNITATTAKAGGNVTDNGGFPVTAKGICWNTLGSPDLSDRHTTNGNGNGSFNSNMTELSAGSTYYVRAYATNQHGTEYGQELTFTTLSGTCSITLGVATNVSSSAATCSANITSDGGDAVTERGFCWSTAQYPTITNTHASAGSGTGGFSSSLINLSLSTTYYVRAYATNSIGTSYSNQISFTTTDGKPVVTVDAASNITATSVTCGGSISSDGGFSVTDKGLVWSTSQYPTVNDNRLSFGSGTSAFSGLINNLSIGTTYYVRAYATNSQGTAYSSQRTFTTASGLPTVTTTAPTRYDNLTVVTGGTVSSDGGYTVTSRGVCYGLTPNPDISASHTQIVDGSGGTGSFTSTFTMPGQGTYYIRAYATNANGTSYGAQKTVNHPYNDLPTFTYGGQTYRIAPAASDNMTWSDANSYCNNLTLYGYSDWRLPSRDELYAMREVLNVNSTWWSSTSYNSSEYYYLIYRSGSGYWDDSHNYNNSSIRYSVRPIRVEN